MAHVKAAIKNAMREEISRIDGVYSCWIEKCQRDKDGTYRILVRTDDSLNLGVLDEISRLFKGAYVGVESGYETTGCCELCEGTESYLELDITNATFSQGSVALRQAT
jgi:hypothetical protein